MRRNTPSIKTDTFYFYTDMEFNRDEIYYVFGVDEPSDIIYYYIFLITNADTPNGFTREGQAAFSGVCRHEKAAKSFFHDIEVGKIKEISEEEVLEKFNHSPIVRVLKSIFSTED